MKVIKMSKHLQKAINESELRNSTYSDLIAGAGFAVLEVSFLRYQIVK